MEKITKLFGIPLLKTTIRSDNPENPATDLNKSNWLYSLLGGGGDTSSGNAVTVDNSLTFSAIYACVRIIAETIASLPLGKFEAKDSGIYPLPDRFITVRPSPLMTRFIFLETIITHVLLWGNCYARIIRNGSAAPVKLDIIHPSKIKTLLTAKGDLYYKIAGVDKQIAAIDMIHIQGLTFDGITGLSPISYHKEMIGAGLAQNKFQGAFYKRGATVSGTIEIPGKMDDQQFEHFRTDWEKTYSGSDNNFKTAILEAGAKYTAIGIKPIDAQYIETKRFTIEEIARIYRVPLHLLQDLSRSTNNNIEHQSIDFAMHTIRPWLKRIEPEFDYKLLTEDEKAAGNVFYRFNLEGLLRGDVKTRSEFYKSMYSIKAMTPNEIRANENLNPIVGGDEFIEIKNENDGTGNTDD